MERKTVAAFDFDGTITRSDTLLPFIRFACGGGRFVAGMLLHAPLLLAYKGGLYPNWKVKQQIFHWFFRGMPLDKFNSLCRDFFRAKGQALFRPEAVSCISSHLQSGHTVVLVSASIENWVLPFACSLGVSHVICTQAACTSSRRLTGYFATANCYGQEKVTRLTRLFPGRESYTLIAYGDSRGDKELLEYADEPHYKPFWP